MSKAYNFNEHFIDINSYKKGFNELNALMAGSMQELQDYINVMNQLLKIEKSRQAEIRKSAKVLQNETLANEKALKSDTNALKENTDAMRKYAKESEESAKKQKQHTDTIKVAKGSINDIKEQISQLTKEHNELNLETEKGRKDAADYAAKISNLKNTVKGFNDAMRTTNSTMKVQAGSYTDLIQKNKKLVESIKNLNPNLKENAARIKAVQAEINSNTNKLKDYDASMGRNFRNVGNYKSAFQDFGSTLTGVSFSAGGLAIAAAGLALAIGTGVVNALKASVSAAMDFEQQMARVKAISNASDEDFAKLTKTARDLGASTEFTAVQAGQGLEFLAMAGFGVNDAIKTMPALLNLASASQMDLGRSADIVSNIMSGFQLSANDSAMAVDVLAKTTTTSNTNMENLGEAMKYFAPIASTLKIPIAEASAAVGIFGDNGLQGSIATQSFGSALLRLSDPMKKQAQAAKALGIELFDNQGQFKGLTNMVAQLEKATNGMTDKQKLATVNQIAGAEAAKNFLVLLNAQKKVMVDGTEVTLKGSEALGAYTKNIENSNGAAEKMAAIMRNTLKGRIEEFNSALDDLMITIGDELTPAMLEFVKAGLEFIQVVKAAATSEEFKTFAKLMYETAKATAQFITTIVRQFDLFGIQTEKLANLYTKGFDKKPIEEVNKELETLKGYQSEMIRDEKLLNEAISDTYNPLKLREFYAQLNSTQTSRLRIEKQIALLEEEKKRRGDDTGGNEPVIPKLDFGITDENVTNSKNNIDEINEYLLDKLVKNIDLEREINFSMDSAETDQQIADFSKKLADSFGDITLTPNDIIDESVYLDSFNELLASLDKRFALRFRYNALLTDEKARTLGFLSLEIEKEKERLELLKLAKAEAIEIAESQAKLNGLVAQQKEIQLNVNRVKAIEGGITNLFLQLENKRIDKITDVRKQERARYLLQLKQLALEIAFAKIRERLGDSGAKSEIEGSKNSLITAAIGGLGSLLGGFKGGGYTGLGHNFRDNTGDRVAGLVHENEYVVPTPILKNNVASQMVSSLEMFRKTKNEKHLLNIPQKQLSRALESKSISNQTIINNNFNAKEVAQELAKVLPKTDVQQTVNGLIVQQKVGNMTTEYLVNAKKGIVPRF